MAVLLKIRESGDGLGILLPQEVLDHLNAKAGDALELVITPDGLLLKPHDAEFEKKLAVTRQIMRENWDVLQRLADS